MPFVYSYMRLYKLVTTKVCTQLTYCIVLLQFNVNLFFRQQLTQSMNEFISVEFF